MCTHFYILGYDLEAKRQGETGGMWSLANEIVNDFVQGYCSAMSSRLLCCDFLWIIILLFMVFQNDRFVSKLSTEFTYNFSEETVEPTAQLPLCVALILRQIDFPVSMFFIYIYYAD